MVCRVPVTHDAADHAIVPHRAVPMGSRPYEECQPGGAQCSRPPKLRSKSHADLVREFLSRAGVMLNLAGELGLVTQDEAVAILRDTGSDHPELDEWLTT